VKIRSSVKQIAYFDSNIYQDLVELGGLEGREGSALATAVEKRRLSGRSNEPPNQPRLIGVGHPLKNGTMRAGLSSMLNLPGSLGAGVEGSITTTAEDRRRSRSMSPKTIPLASRIFTGMKSSSG
jgi:hypothetical protein